MPLSLRLPVLTAVVIGPAQAAESLNMSHPTEAYQLNFHNTNPLRYPFCTLSRGREARLEKSWGE